MKTFHLTNTQNGWKLKAEKSDRAVKIFKEDKETAVKESAKILKASGENVSLIIHKTDGAFQEERTYPRGADPVKSRG